MVGYYEWREHTRFCCARVISTCWPSFSPGTTRGETLLSTSLCLRDCSCWDFTGAAGQSWSQGRVGPRLSLSFGAEDGASRAVITAASHSLQILATQSFSCSNTETKPRTDLGEEESRSVSHPICGVWEVYCSKCSLSGWGTDSCRVSCHLRAGPVCILALEKRKLKQINTLENLNFSWFFPT